MDPNKPQPLLDFKHLPDRVGTREFWWVFEAWRRYDPRIRFVGPFSLVTLLELPNSSRLLDGKTSGCDKNALIVAPTPLAMESICW